MSQGTRSLIGRLTTAAALLASCCLSRPSSAEPGAVAKLELTRSSAASHCMGATALVRSVEARLGRQAFAREAPLVLRVALDRSGPNWVAELSLSDSAGSLGERSLSTRAHDCSALDDSLALVVALLVDTPPERQQPAPTTSVSATVPATAPAAAPAAPRSAPSTRLILPADTWAPRAPWQFAARGGGSVLFFALPGVAYGPLLGVAARPPRGPWLKLSAELALPKESHSADGARGVRVSSERAALWICSAPPESASVDLQYCAGQRVGRINAEGLGFDHSLSVSRLYWAAALGGELAIRLTKRLYLPLGLFLEIPLTRDRFVARDGTDALHRVPVVAGAATAAIEFRGGS